jgi:hypothetical protein
VLTGEDNADRLARTWQRSGWFLVGVTGVLTGLVRRDRVILAVVGIIPTVTGAAAHHQMDQQERPTVDGP